MKKRTVFALGAVATITGVIAYKVIKSCEKGAIAKITEEFFNEVKDGSLDDSKKVDPELEEKIEEKLNPIRADVC